MKKIRCPKCDSTILFDESRYEAGRVLVFQCPDCNKQFKIRMPRPKNAPAAGESGGAARQETPAAHLTVLENDFHFRQELPLLPGENVIGRYVRDTAANTPIRTVDPSVDTRHCIVTVCRKADGSVTLALRDAPSNTGTFLQGELLGDRESAFLADGDVINIGATTMILHID